jgi:hypothetical protein
MRNGVFMKGTLHPRVKEGSRWLAWEDLYCVGMNSRARRHMCGQSGVQYSPSSPSCRLS